ncbi:alpha/beta fold hydrolase [Aliiglaciecola sp. M165]|uniref:alpha/beta fold hydrolase n=1 Tax=Aliiglaciecola sp. M165 TaxID=2593649 RepID=UPI00117F3798|nr:alpha/beta hydrolase [Aliiglaciecola sp. M165]TRY33875.1 hypothetical protein FM019_01035 [Aliiglaciecola sp. M165]
MSSTQLHFVHANGFPAGCYSSFLGMLKNVEVKAIEKISHKSTVLPKNLDALVEEFVDSVMAGFEAPVIAMGHSTGACVVGLAASRYPYLFKGVIMLEPIFLSTSKRLIIGFLKTLGLIDYFGPSGAAKKRKNRFATINDARIHFSRKNLFSNFDNACFEDFMESGFYLKDGTIHLSFSTEIEAQLFRTILVNIPRQLKHVKSTIIFGSKSNMISSWDVSWCRNSMFESSVQMVQGGHMFPLEMPRESAQLINETINVINSHENTH